MAGASAVEIGTANFLDPAVSVKVVRGIDAWLDAHGIASVRDIIAAAE
jgi:dihydroorotate dehydrogenase (NAD+) catalytic subunit